MSRHYAPTKDVDRLARDKVREGWLVERTGGGHLRWVSPGGRVYVSGTTVGSSAVRRLREMVRRIERDEEQGW